MDPTWRRPPVSSARNSNYSFSRTEKRKRKKNSNRFRSSIRDRAVDAPTRMSEKKIGQRSVVKISTRKIITTAGSRPVATRTRCG